MANIAPPAATAADAGTLGQGTRLASVELLRILGAFGIVLFHLRAPGAWIGYAALPLFIMLSFYFSLLKASRPGHSPPLADRVKRYMLPWVFWSGVFFVLKVIDATTSGQPLASEFDPWMLATGPAIHLWFLPFMAFFAVVGLNRQVITWVSGTPPVILSAVICAVFFALFRGIELASQPPWQQWLFGLPAILASLVFFNARVKGSRTGILILLICTSGYLYFGTGDGSMQPLLAIFLMLIALNIPLPSNGVIDRIAGLALGVYVMHPAVVAVLMRVVPDVPRATLSFTLVVFALSLAGTFVLRKLPVFRRFV